MELKVPFLADRQLESAATELLRKYAKWKCAPPRPPIPVDDIVEGLLELSLSIGDLRTRLGKNDVLGATRSTTVAATNERGPLPARRSPFTMRGSMRKFVGAVWLVLAVMGGVARAADAPAAACRPPDHDRALKLQENATALMKAATAVPLEKKETLKTLKTVPPALRDSVARIRCDEPALSPKELKVAQDIEARAAKWADDEDRALGTESTTRENVVVPLCEAIWGRDAAQATIDHEKSNPSGVVDLRVLHDAGESLQQYRAQIAALTPLYVAARHHGFSNWQAEGACVAASKASE